MSFWIFMFLTLTIIPLSMIIIGKYFTKSPPKKINKMFGYRTKMSMKNNDTWRFAHELSGKLMYKLGLISLPITTLPFIFVLGENEETIGNFSMILIIIQTVAIFIPIILTEKALKDNFDKDGTKYK